MKRALSDLVIEGIRSNIAFHSWTMEQPEFREGKLDTGFIARCFRPESLQPDDAELDRFVAAAVIRAYELDRRPKLPRSTGLTAWARSGRGHEGNV
jgi:acetyl-CoA carboxylase biotin carboxylase subunit